MAIYEKQDLGDFLSPQVVFPPQTFCLVTQIRILIDKTHVHVTVVGNLFTIQTKYFFLYLFLLLLTTTVIRCHLKSIEQNIGTIQITKQKFKFKFNRDHVEQILMLEILNNTARLIITRDPVDSFVRLLLLSGSLPDDLPPGGVDEAAGLGLDAPDDRLEAAPLVREGAVDPKASVGVPLLADVPHVHGPVWPAVSLQLRASRVEGNDVLVSESSFIEGSGGAKHRTAELGRSGHRVYCSARAVIGRQYPGLGRRERDRTVRPVDTNVQECCTDTQLSSSVHSPVHGAWAREFPEEAEHCFEDTIAGTPGSRTVARGRGRPVGLEQSIAERGSLCPADTQPGEAKSVQNVSSIRCRQCRLHNAAEFVLMRINEGLGARPE